MRITHLRGVELTDPAPGQIAGFYERIWGLQRVATGGESVYLRGTGSEHHILSVHPGTQTTVRGYRLGLAERAAVDSAAEGLRAQPATRIVAGPGPLESPGGGYGLRIIDPDGREIELSAEVARAGGPDAAPGGPPIRPTKVSHVVLNSPNADAYLQLLIEVLGFRVADETEHMVFLKCNLDHHSVAIARAPHASLNHVAFEVPTVEDVLAGVEHMRAHGFETIWGPGRHPQGMNAFGYFLAPNGQVVEYTAEVEQIPDDQLAPRFWVPADYEVYDDWADISSLRPTPETRTLMRGVPELAPHGAS
ncbi:MAG: extradiol ring-cleavage dioxygenase [Acidimicrobiia bacterium]|nr:extradiol ring-cleavage dioxygenase [Acidimicrobiia bacterium]